MNTFELFEFKDYLDKEQFKKIEFIFLSQCLDDKFTEFKTSLGSNGKDYLSYLIAHALVDGTLENSRLDHQHFFKLANGYTERFFQTTIYHVANISNYLGRENIIPSLVQSAEKFISKPLNKSDFKDFQMKDYLKNFIDENKLNNSFYILKDYSYSYKQLESLLLKENLDEGLEIKNLKQKNIKL